jgi:hypothetical protein
VPRGRRSELPIGRERAATVRRPLLVDQTEHRAALIATGRLRRLGHIGLQPPGRANTGVRILLPRFLPPLRGDADTVAVKRLAPYPPRFASEGPIGATVGFASVRSGCILLLDRSRDVWRNAHIVAGARIARDLACDVPGNTTAIRLRWDRTDNDCDRGECRCRKWPEREMIVGRHDSPCAAPANCPAGVVRRYCARLTE